MEEASRTLPHDLDAERAVLGALILHGDRIHEVADILEPSTFYRGAHQRIYKHVAPLAQRGGIDLILLKESLVRSAELDEVGGSAYIAALVDGMPRQSNLLHYARIVSEKKILRDLIFASNKTLGLAYDGEAPASEVLDGAVARLLDVGRQVSQSDPQPLSALVPAHFERMNEVLKPDSPLRGFPTGFASLDYYLVGLRPGSNNIVAGQTGFGKTSFALDVAKSLARRQIPVAVFTQEMTTPELLDRMICAEAGIDGNRMYRGELERDEWAQVGQAREILEALPIWIDDRVGLTPVQYQMAIRRLQGDHGVRAAVVDYLQLMRPPARKDPYRTAEERISAISWAMKEASKATGIASILVAQLSRAPNLRPDPRPILSDLRESGRLEQDADAVIFIHRPDKCPQRRSAFRRKKAEDSETVRQEVERGVAEISLAKHRHGPTTDHDKPVRLFFRKEFARFEALAL